MIKSATRLCQYCSPSTGCLCSWKWSPLTVCFFKQSAFLHTRTHTGTYTHRHDRAAAAGESVSVCQCVCECEWKSLRRWRWKRWRKCLRGGSSRTSRSRIQTPPPGLFFFFFFLRKCLRRRASSCLSSWRVCSGSGSSTVRKPRWTLAPWAPECRCSGSFSAAAWTHHVSSSTVACVSSTAASRRAPSTGSSWRWSSSPPTRSRNTGRTSCSRCRGLRCLSKRDTRRYVNASLGRLRGPLWGRDDVH